MVERAKQIGSVKTIEHGAATTVFAATSPLLDGKGGVYLVDCDIARVSDGDHDVRAYAIDPANASRLWTWSERVLA